MKISSVRLRIPFFYLVFILFSIILGGCQVNAENHIASSANEALNSEEVSIQEEELIEKAAKAIDEKEFDAFKYIKSVESTASGLKNEKQFGAFIAVAQYKPVLYEVFKSKKTFNIPKYELDSLISQYSGMEYYTVEIISKSAQNILKTARTEISYPEKVTYLAFENQHNFQLQVGKQIKKPAIYHFERGYGLGNSITMILAFPNSESKEDRVLTYDEKLLGLGKIKFRTTYQNILKNLNEAI